MATIAENLTTLINNKANIKEAIEEKKGSSITSNMGLWSNIIVNLPENTSSSYIGDHVDENGIWHKPADWPDIESLEVPDDEDVVYLLYGNHLHEYAFAAFTVTIWSIAGGTIFLIDKGTISNGTFVVTENVASNKTSSFTYREMLCDSQDDYTIYRIKATTGGIGEVTTTTMPATSNSYGYYGDAVSNTILMRYGRMKYGRSPVIKSFWLESDNVTDIGSVYPSTISWALCYLNCKKLLRWRHTGWNTSKSTSFTGFFNGCSTLSDIDSDFSGWVTSNCVNITTMFSSCYSLRYINLSNWDVSNVTSFASLFASCLNLREIKGLDTWASASKVTTVASMFYLCYLLQSDLDLENLAITNKCTTISNIFIGCTNVKYISIKGWDLSKVTTINSICSGCRALETFNMDNIVAPTNLCTNFSSAFNACVSLKSPLVFNGWNFSGATVNSTIYNLVTNVKCSLIIFRNCTFPSSLTTQNNSYPLVGTLYLVKEVNYGDFNASIYTGTQVSALLANLWEVIDLYPPTHINKALNISACYKISHDSILRIFNNLDTVTGTVKLIMGAPNLSKMTASEIAIATNKGWTVSAT